MDLTNLIGILGGLCGVASLYYVRSQTRLLQQQMQAMISKDETYIEWAVKLGKAVDAITKVYSGMIRKENYATPQPVQGIIFDPELRDCIERYLGSRSRWSGNFTPKLLNQEQLLNPVVQQVIKEVLDAIETFKREHTDWARSINLLK